MLEHKIHRSIFTEKSSIGHWTINGVFECFTLEDKDREVPDQSVHLWKIPGATAIPRGKYRLVIDDSSRFKRPMPHLLTVPGFTGIRVHSGNTAADTEGCIIVGQRQGQDTLWDSRPAFTALFEKIKNGGDDQWLEIT